MAIRYSYDSLMIFRTTDGTFGWIHQVNPATYLNDDGFDFGVGEHGTESFPPGLMEAPEGAETLEYRHHAGACAGDRKWDFLAYPPSCEWQEEWDSRQRELLFEVKQAVKNGLLPADPEGLLE